MAVSIIRVSILGYLSLSSRLFSKSRKIFPICLLLSVDLKLCCKLCFPVLDPNFAVVSRCLQMAFQESSG